MTQAEKIVGEPSTLESLIARYGIEMSGEAVAAFEELAQRESARERPLIALEGTNTVEFEAASSETSEKGAWGEIALRFTIDGVVKIYEYALKQ